MTLIAAHPQLARLAALLAFCVLLFGALYLAALRFSYRGRRRGRARAGRIAHAPRHTRRPLAHRGTPAMPLSVPAYVPRHEADVHGPAVLGAFPDGDITLVHADPPAEPAVQVRPEDEITVRVPALTGAAA